MGKRFVKCFALAGFAVLVTMTWVTGAAAQVTNISTCQTLPLFGHTYRVTADIVACGDCLIVANNRITIDLQGHKISQGAGCGPAGGAGVTDLGVARDQIIVKDGEISSGVAVADKFFFGIVLQQSTRTEVRNIVTHDNLSDGIVVGNQSIIAGLANVAPKTCRSTFNGVTGIFGFDRVQVQNCEASNNGGHGIEVRNRCLVTRNIANSNGEDGIRAGPVAGPDAVPPTQAFCDVTFNTANNNGLIAGEGSGIDVEGSNNVVTGNTTNNNLDEGLAVQCPSTVTNNNSSGNGLNYEFEGPGVCITTNNN